MFKVVMCALSISLLAIGCSKSGSKGSSAAPIRINNKSEMTVSVSSGEVFVSFKHLGDKVVCKHNSKTDYVWIEIGDFHYTTFTGSSHKNTSAPINGFAATLPNISRVYDPSLADNSIKINQFFYGHDDIRGTKISDRTCKFYGNLRNKNLEGALVCDQSMNFKSTPISINAKINCSLEEI
jgi:hypothetical protein